ncbi:MAG: LysR family transcriptional regulator [Paracoccaceae bacterium]|nr:LysR family transcriptional regulator [Paracoccaceae bacterium]
MHLPSLTALRAFEAAARAGGFSAAARELNVTHAAVAQQVRALEAHLSLTLLVREGRGLRLTDEGARLATALAQGFATIADAIAELAEADRARPLRISVTHSFATQWLMPRLGGFWARHPEIALSLHPDNRVVDLAAERIDLAIRCGRGGWAGVEAELLTPTHFTVVGAPALLGDTTSLTPAEMARFPWVIESGWPEQLAWLSSLGIDPESLETHEVPTEDLALSAARQGYGLHVELSTLLDEEVASGRLRAVHASRAGEGMSYWLVTRPGPKKPALKTLLRWLKSVA